MVVLLVINLIIAVIWLILGLLPGRDRKRTVIYFVLMLLVPVFFESLLALTWLMRLVTGFMHVDLSDVIFGKDKAAGLQRGNAEEENNLVPIEEALAVADTTSLRTFMLNILKGDVSSSLNKLKEALLSSDTETAHYAATVLREELGRFRSTVFRSFAAIQNAKGEEKDETCIVTIRYMNEYLKKDLFSEDEMTEYVTRLADIGDIVFNDDYTLLTVDDMYGIAMRLLDAGLYSRCRQWCIRLADTYPDVKESYLAIMSFCFRTGRKDGFRQGMQELMDSGIPVDETTMKNIRAFRQEK